MVILGKQGDCWYARDTKGRLLYNIGTGWHFVAY